MPIVNGRIDNKISQEGMGQKGPWTKWTLEIGGYKYSTFNEVQVAPFSIDDYVSMEYEFDKTGKYRNIKYIKLADPITHPAIQAKQEAQGEGSSLGVQTPQINHTPKEFHLTSEAVRIGALDAAIKVTKKTGTDDYPADLFSNFKQFERWILTGEDD